MLLGTIPHNPLINLEDPSVKQAIHKRSEIVPVGRVVSVGPILGFDKSMAESHFLRYPLAGAAGTQVPHDPYYATVPGTMDRRAGSFISVETACGRWALRVDRNGNPSVALVEASSGFHHAA